MIRALLLIVVVLLAGCGKKGAPTPPGPQSDVTYEKSYPVR